MLAAVRRVLRLGIHWARVRKAGSPEPDMRLTACRLLLEVALADGRVTEQERHCIESALSAQFGLGLEGAKGLLAAGTEARTASVDLRELAAGVAGRYSDAQKKVLARLLVGVAASDGCCSRSEDYTVRRICSLLRVDPGLA